MVPSPQLLFRKDEEQQAVESGSLPLLSLISFDPVGNPLSPLKEMQRQQFLDSLRQLLHLQKKEMEARTLTIAQNVAESQLPRILSVKKESAAMGLAAGTSLASQQLRAQQKLAQVVDDYSRGDQAKAAEAVQEFESRLRQGNFRSDDLMAVMLLVIEDKVWEGEEGSPAGAQSGGTGMRVQRLVPQKLREAAKDSAEVRLASVREMLRYYFKAHPKDYALALASALSLTADQEGDNEFLQERLASELARIGGFALAQKLLAELKLRKKMDAKKCMLQLGYHYDAKGKRLVIGKRTCGKPIEAKGIIGLLVAAAAKKEGK